MNEGLKRVLHKTIEPIFSFNKYSKFKNSLRNKVVLRLTSERIISVDELNKLS